MRVQHQPQRERLRALQLGDRRGPLTSPGAARRAGSEPADRLGLAYERRLDEQTRRVRGAFYTPAPIASALVERVVDGPAGAGPPTVCDPAVGGGAFLLAAARVLERRGIDRRTVVERHLWGMDLDPDAVAVTVAALAEWAQGRDRETGAADVSAIAAHVVVGDALAAADPWRGGAPSFDVVVGNPPFLNQLERATVRSAESVEAARARFGPAVSAYTDTSTLFVLAALDLAPEGRIGLVLPESFLVARDAGPTRAEILRRARLLGLWSADAKVFGAAVDVCALVLAAGAHRSPTGVARWSGPSFEPLPPADPPSPGDGPWAGLRSAAPSLPRWGTAGAGRLGDLTTATAGFRDQYYGLHGCIVDEGAPGDSADAGIRGGQEARGRAVGPALVTSGLIDPLACHWGSRPARFARRRWTRPRVVLDRLERTRPDVAAWARARMRPKILLATQTRVLEGVADVRGEWYPSTPVISVEPDPDTIWRVLAVLIAPSVTVLAHTRYGGGALSREALKLSARQVLDLPLPSDEGAWQRAADLLESGAGATLADRLELLGSVGAAMCEAYDADDAVLGWWRERLPAARR